MASIANQGSKHTAQSLKAALLMKCHRPATLIILWMFLLVVMALSPLTAHAEKSELDTAATPAATAVPADNQLIDPFGRQTPRSTIQGFIKALSANDAPLASNYLDLEVGDNSVETVRQLRLALDTGGRIDNEIQLSNEPSGNLADKLAPNLEKVGTITVDEQVIDIILVRKTAAHGNQYWQFSAETIDSIKQADLSLRKTLVDKYTIDALKDKDILGYSVADIVAVLALALLCILIAYTVIGLLYLISKRLYPIVRNKPLPIDAKVILPLALVITSMLLYEVMVYAGVSVTVREPVNRIKDIVGWFAFTWLLLRVVDAIFNRAERQSYRRHQTERVSILSLLHKLVKALLLILASIYIFGSLGFDLTTGIAALGVGGLALALGAQKMIENLVGSVMLVADQPVRVGDYCRFGEFEGTVIDIGIRSTRLRTLNRTVVTVPNGEFSSLSIENFTSRDMFHFQHNLYIKRNADATTLEAFINGMNDFIAQHELTNAEWNQVRVAELRQDCIVIEIRAYVNASGGILEFYDKQSQLMIEMLKQVEHYPVEHALPTTEMIIETTTTASAHRVPANVVK